MRRLVHLGVLAVLAWPSLSYASHAIVPDDFATIPAAIASGADTVFVRDGDYPAAITIARTLVMMPMPPVWPSLPPYPSIGAITIDDPAYMSDEVHVQHMRVTGAVNWNTARLAPALVAFDGCRLDAGLTATGASASVTLRLQGCIIRGEVFAYLYYPDIVGCTFLQCGVRVMSHGTVRIRDNYFVGPAAWGIRTCCEDATWDIRNNLIVGTTNGVWAGAGRFDDNEVRDTGGAAYFADGSSGRARFYGNVALRPGGAGIEMSDATPPETDHVASGNRVEDAAGDGIRSLSPGVIRGNTVLRSHGDGIIAVSHNIACNSNVVLASGERGIVTGYGGQVDSNVVGRSGEDGILVTNGDEVAHNTSYLNGNDGFAVQGTLTPADHNIGYGNLGYGFRCAAPGAAALSCNDWYGNIAGATDLCPAGATDLAVAPGFCDLPADDVHLSQGSPLLGAPGCGLIGALGQGCSTPVSVEEGEGPLFNPRATPFPARAAVSFRWDPRERVDRIDVYDVRGARVRAFVPGGASEGIQWDGRDSVGRPVPAGLYLARFTTGRGELTARVMFIR